jgi:hypothetical protein
MLAMKKHTFYPSIDGSLEDRLALSTTGTAAALGAHIHAAKPVVHVKHPVVTTKQIDRVDAQVNAAFNAFNREYSRDLNTLARTGNHATFNSQFATGVARLRNSLAIDANRLPFGKTNLNSALQARVDSLVSELKTNTKVSSTDLITADRYGAHQDVNTFIHDEVTSGDISVK